MQHTLCKRAYKARLRARMATHRASQPVRVSALAKRAYGNDNTYKARLRARMAAHRASQPVRVSALAKRAYGHE